MKIEPVKIKIKKRKARGDWGAVKPYTRIERDKTEYRRVPKHKAAEDGADACDTDAGG